MGCSSVALSSPLGSATITSSVRHGDESRAPAASPLGSRGRGSWPLPLSYAGRICNPGSVAGRAATAHCALCLLLPVLRWLPAAPPLRACPPGPSFAHGTM